MDQNPTVSKAALSWLLEFDPENPGIRYFTLTDLLDRPSDDPEVIAAQRNVMETGPVPVILGNQNPDGYWCKPGSGYYPKYFGTHWQIIFLAQLGATGKDPRIRKGVEQVLKHNLSPNGGFSMNENNSGLIHCLQGNLCAAIIFLGLKDDPRFEVALDWMARSVTGEGIAPSAERKTTIRYLRSGNSGPGFLCSANNHLPCAWGAVKVMGALVKIPPAERTLAIQNAINLGVEFLQSRDPAQADYPMGFSEKPNRSWFKLGYPIGYVSDFLEILEVLTALGCGGDPALGSAVDLLLKKQGPADRWKLEYTYNGKTWVDIEKRGYPSKWVTLRALRVLKRITEQGFPS